MTTELAVVIGAAVYLGGILATLTRLYQADLSGEFVARRTYVVQALLWPAIAVASVLLIVGLWYFRWRTS